MRKPAYYSPSAIKLFFTDRTAYYKAYLADVKYDRTPQTKPMAAGSAFDAFVKSYLAQHFYGEVRPEFDTRVLFEQQVEKPLWDEAWEVGRHLFLRYKDSGALTDIMGELSLAVAEPRFEFSVQGKVTRTGHTPEGFTLLGKPDLSFVTKSGRIFVYDWKCNGYYARSKGSPAKGYIKSRDTATKVVRQHKDMVPMSVDGIIINCYHSIDTINEEWADQLTIYSWLLGAPVGSDFLVGIEQLLGQGWDEITKPNIIVSSIRGTVTPGYQNALYDKIVRMHHIIESGHIFDELPFEESRKIQAQFDSPPTDPNERWLAMECR